MAADWNTCARELGRALSRYNGLTNSVSLHYITEVIASDIFEKQPFCYAYTIINELKEKGLGSRSAEVYLHHAINFGFLYRATSGGKQLPSDLIRKQESTSHIALTALGRACRAAVKWRGGINDFKEFLWMYALLEYDFDMYGLFIRMSYENNDNVVEKSNFFQNFYAIRKEQIEWMKKKFPHAVQRMDIQRKMQWIGVQNPVYKAKLGSDLSQRRTFKLDSVVQLAEKSKEHHFNQRKKWAKDFGHLDKDGRLLTESGKKLASYLPTTTESPFFWLGPSEECVRSRFISSAGIASNSYAPAWNLLRPQPISEFDSPSNELINETSSYMREAFTFIRLGHFAQASLDAVAPYVYFLEQKLEMQNRVGEHKLFQAVIEKNRDRFACSLQYKLSQSHYRLRQVG